MQKMITHKRIKGVAMDVDGVLTDGSFWWGSSGEEFKRFNFADTTGISQAMKAGIQIALISGESSDPGMRLVQRLADKLKIPTVYKGCHDKEAAVREFAEKHAFQLDEICFIGDDVIDIPAMLVVGLSAVPADAQTLAKSKAKLVLKRNGGQGAVRELLDMILEAHAEQNS
jgi:3-deoxy-D-manno-octulosonate 8-phosphate phosphatase (KDO 8-P phosphatase)